MDFGNSWADILPLFGILDRKVSIRHVTIRGDPYVGSESLLRSGICLASLLCSFDSFSHRAFCVTTSQPILFLPATIVPIVYETGILYGLRRRIRCMTRK